MGEDRPGWLLEAWARGWPEGAPVASESGMPGVRLDWGPFVVETFGIPRRERAGGADRAVPAAAFRIHFSRTVIACVVGCTGGAVVGRVCRGADLAYLDASTLPLHEAVQAGQLAGEAWVVGPQGELIGGEAT
jgi:hypothetical protein